MVRYMTSRDIIAKNIKALMQKHDHSENDLFKLSKVAQSTINRTLKRESAITIDKLDAIAHVYGVASWQLMIPDLDTDNPQMLKVLSIKEQNFYIKMQAVMKELQ